MLRSLTILMLLTFHVTKSTVDFYTAAVVEYNTPSTPLLSGDQVLVANAKNYIEFMRNASLEKVDIIVFPEGTLSGHNRNKMIEVPDPLLRVNLCSENETYHEALVILSCAAQEYKIYTVVNLIEKYYNTNTNNTEYYNTNLAFDRNGTAIARYRKYNPYGEFVNKPEVPDHSIIQTDFGVKFGMFTCFDIEFFEPAILMAKSYGIQHFVFPNCWVSELPFLTALQMQWGWAYSLQVVLLAAGCNRPETGGSGSGIYHGTLGALEYIQTNAVTSRLLIARVPTTFNYSDTLQAKADQYSYSEPPSKSYLIDDFFFTHFNPVVPEDTDGADVSASNNSLWMLQDYLDVYQTVPLLTQQDSDESSSEQIIRDNSSLVISLNTTTIMCHQDFCCDFKIKMQTTFSATKPPEAQRGDDFSQYYYRLALFDGVRWYGGGVATGGIQVCGVIPCANRSLSSCGLRADDPSHQLGEYNDQGRTLYRINTQFQFISITPTFFYNSTFVFPDILVTGSGDGFGAPIPQQNFTYETFDSFNYSIVASLTINSPVDNLITAAVYARQFDRDGLPRTVPSSHNDYHPKSIILFVVLYVIVCKCFVLY